MDPEKRPTGWGGATAFPPDPTEIQAASERLKQVIVRTPLIPLHSFDKTTDIFLKPEILQPTGSYKIRGAYNWAASLTAEERGKAVCILSGGSIDSDKLKKIIELDH